MVRHKIQPRPEWQHPDTSRFDLVEIGGYIVFDSASGECLGFLHRQGRREFLAERYGPDDMLETPKHFTGRMKALRYLNREDGNP